MRAVVIREAGRSCIANSYVRFGVLYRPKLVTVPTKLEKREKAREAKAEVAAKLDRVKSFSDIFLLV